MAQVNINYVDLRGQTFERIRGGLVHHLTPPEGQKIHPMTAWDLGRARRAIQNPGPYEVEFTVDHSYAGPIACDLGLFPGVDPEELGERYRVMRPMGGGSSHRVSIFGKDVGGVGDYPLTIRIQSDDAGLYQADTLFLLKDWRDRLLEVGGDKAKFAQPMMEMFRGAQGISREHDRMVADTPNTIEEFDRKIKEMQERLWGIMFEGSINILRFGYDFLGRPMENLGIHPDSIRIVGSGNFELMLEGKFGDQNSGEGKQLYAHPEVPTKELAKLIILEFPETKL